MPTSSPRGARRLAALLAVVLPLAVAADALAGDVTLTRKGRKVTIAAGDGDESIVLSLQSAGVMRVQSGAEGTTIVNGSESSIEVGPKDQVVVQLGDGNHVVTLQGSLPPFRQLTMIGGDGNDLLQLNGASVTGALKLQDAAGGSNSLAMNNATVSGRVTIAGGVGSETFTVINSTLGGGLTAAFGKDTGPQGGNLMGATIRSSLVVSGGGGDDAFQFVDSTVEKTVSWNGGNGNDTLSINGNCDFQRNVLLRGGSGVDNVSIDNGPDFQGTLTVDGGAGNDAIVVRECGLFLGAKLLGGNDADTFEIAGFTSLRMLTVSCGAGDDALRIDAFRPPDLRDFVVLDGGPGGDDEVNGANLLSVPATKRILRRGFERVVDAEEPPPVP